MLNDDNYIINQLKQEILNYTKNKDIVNVEVITHIKLDKETEALIRNYIKKKLKLKKINIISTIDKSILGGFIVKIGDTMLDYSLKTKVEEIEEKIEN